jgi:uncharacterized protein YndB with AHSA1/START domain
MNALDFVLDRVVNIRARRETVFRYFTDSARFAAWWGAGSSIEPRPGGRVAIRFPNGIEAGGEVLEILPPERIVFSYGFASGQPLPIGASRVTVTLEQAPDGTLVRLRHELPNAEVRDEHVQGWRYQLALFANVATREQHQDVAALAAATSRCGGSPTPRSVGPGWPRSATNACRSMIPTAAAKGWRTSTPTSPPASASCPAWPPNAAGRFATARALRSCRGSRARRQARSGRRGRTSSSWLLTGAFGALQGY